MFFSPQIFGEFFRHLSIINMQFNSSVVREYTLYESNPSVATFSVVQDIACLSPS